MLALLAPFAVAGAVIGTPGPAKAADPVTFTVAFTGDVDSLNPFTGYNAESYELWSLSYDYMVGYSMKDMSPVPALATDWNTSKDGLTWTFDIRSGVKWQDGQPLTAADIAYTYNRVLTGKVEGGNYSSYLTNVESVTAPDDTHVVLTLSKPNAVLPLVPIPILPEHVWKDIDSKEVKTFQPDPSNPATTVGSGPFRLVEGATGGSTFRYEANPDYWGGAPHVDQVVFKVYKSKDPAIQALIKGEVDYVNDITALQVDALKDKPGISAQIGISPIFEEIGFNTGAIDSDTGKPIGDGNPAVLDPTFRHALGWAVDNNQIVKTAFQGGALPGTTIVPSAYSKWHWEPPDDVKFHFDLDKAAEELDAAGYTKGADGKRTMPDGSPIGTLRLFARSEAKDSVDTMDLFQGWLGELGIDSEVTAMDGPALGDRILEGTYDVFQWDWYVEPDPDGILADFTCDQRGGLNDSNYCDADYDAMYQAQNGEMDKDKRAEIVHQMQQQLYEDAPYLVTAETGIGEAVRNDRFACFQPQPDPGGVWLVQYGVRNYTLFRPAADAGDCDGVTSALGANAESGNDSSGEFSKALVIGGSVVAVLVIVGVVVMLRRRSTAAERE
ncbi:MAG TPA: ABC transporter substrate-binding protein [Nocardioides sp.]|nr:ABC transporter substrate-binding protein [Nocardioides sp.]